MEDLCRNIFVTKGMCVQFAIHDSENKKTGQRNLHVHMMATLRGIDEQGNWMPKQKKVYLTDENGERIPLIDKATGLQKVDKQNRKQWKCRTVPTNDWMIHEVAKRNSNRLRLPIVGTKYLREISDRATLQKMDWMEDFVRENGWTKFGEMMADKVLLDEEYDGFAERRKEMTERMSYLEGLLDVYKLYEPYIKNNKE